MENDPTGDAEAGRPPSLPVESTKTVELPTVGQSGAEEDAPTPVPLASPFVANFDDGLDQDDESASETLAAALRELEAAQSDADRTRLHHAIGVFAERQLADQRRAVHHYQEAYRLTPDHLPSIQAARQLFWQRQNWAMVLALLDAELRLTTNASRAARLLVQKGRIYDDWLANVTEARAAFEQALERDPGAQQALFCLRRLLRRSDDHEALLDICRRAVSATSDRSQRAVLYAEMARVREADNAVDAAIEDYSAAFSEDPTLASAANALKRLYHRRGRWGDLVDVLLGEGELSRSPRRRALAYVGSARLCRDRLNQPDRAMELLNRARGALRKADKTRADIVVLQEVAELLHRSGRYAELTETYRELIQVLEDTGEKVVVHHRLGQLLEERLEREPEAIEHYRRALALDGTYLPALQSLGRLYARRGDWADLVRMQATEADAISDARERANHLCSVADLCEARLGDAPRAIELQKRALAAFAGHVRAQRAVERLAVQLGDWAALLSLLEAQLEGLEGEQASSHLTRMAQLCEERLQDEERALHYYGQALELRPQDLALIRALQRLYGQSGQYGLLLELLDREAELIDDEELTVSLWHQAAEVCEQRLDRADDAKARYLKVLERRPQHRPTFRAFGRLLHREADWDGLIALYRRELEVETTAIGRAQLLYKIGEIHEERLTDPAKALSAYREAVEADASFRPGFRALARLHQQGGDWEALLSVMERRIALIDDPAQRAALLYAIGEIWEWRLRRPDKALQFYRQGFELLPDHDACREAVLRLLLVDGASTEAIEVYEQALAHAFDDATRAALLKALGEVLAERMLDPKRAIDCYEQVLSLFDDDAEALEALSRLCRGVDDYQRVAEVHTRLAAICEDPAEAIGQLYEAAAIVEVYLQPDWDPAPLYERVVELSTRADSSIDVRLALDALGRSYEARGDHAGLVRVGEARLVLEEPPPVRRSHLLRLAAACEANGDLSRAQEALAEALALEADWLVAHQHRRAEQRLEQWEAIPATLLREAELSRDPKLSVDCLMRAARLYVGRLNDPSAAVGALERLLELDPLHEEAAKLLEQLLVRQGAWARLVEIGLERIDRAQRQGNAPIMPQLEILVRVAWIQREHLEAPRDAVTTLARAVKLDGNHLPALLTLAELHVGLEQWQEAVETYFHVVALTDDPELLRRAHSQLGEIWSGPLADPREAISCFQNVLAVAPEDRDAVRRLHDLFVWCRDWDNAADTIVRLIEMESDPAPQIKLYLELADVYEKGFGDPQAAAEQLDHAMVLDPLADEVVSRLTELHARLGQWQAVCETLRRYLDALPPEQRASGRSRRLRLGEVLRQRLGRSEEALEQYRIAITMDPSDIDARLAVARILAQEGQFGAAVAEHRAILEMNPVQAESLRQLRTIGARTGAQDLSFAAAAVLVGFGMANDVEQRVYREFRAKGDLAPTRHPLSLDVHAAHLRHPDEHEQGRTVLGVLCEVAHRLRPARLPAWSVGKGDRLSPRSEDPLKQLVRNVCATVGLEREVEVYVSSTRAGEMGLLLTDPPSLVVGNDVITSQSQPLIRCQIAHLMAWVRDRRWIAYGLDAQHLSTLINAACRAVDQHHEVASGEEQSVADTARMIQRHLGRRGRRTLDEACTQLLAAEPPDYERWVRAMASTSLRLALWVVDDLETALDYLCRTQPELTRAATDPQRLAQAVRQHPLASDLVRYWLSDAYRAARHAGQL